MKKIVSIKDNEEILRKKSRELDPKELQSNYIKTLKENMKKLLEKEKFGVAIAAPQLGENVAAFLIKGETIAYAKKEDYDPAQHKDMYFFNPKVIKHSKKQVDSDEGCLSVPFKYSYNVPRYEKITVEYLDENGNKQILNASGFLARVLQHEIDHLHGILYIDKAKNLIDVDENMQPIKKES